MSEERAPYLPSTNPSLWVDLRFDDGKHTGVRVLRGTTVIEVQRDGRKKIFDTSECKQVDIETATKACYDR